MRYRLRTLLILLAVLPPMLAPIGAWGWREWQAYRQRQEWWNMIEAAEQEAQRQGVRQYLCPSHPPSTRTPPATQSAPTSGADAGSYSSSG